MTATIGKHSFYWNQMICPMDSLWPNPISTGRIGKGDNFRMLKTYYPISLTKCVPHCPVRLNHDSWTSLDYDSRRGVHSISRETGERQTSLKYLLQEMGKPFDLVAIPKECPEGKNAEKTQTCVGKVDFLQSVTFSLGFLTDFLATRTKCLPKFWVFFLLSLSY